MTEATTTWSTPDDLLRDLDAAFARTKTAHSIDADERLRDAIDAARAAGVAWGAIGARLGMARGNAYQRYRRRPA
jgi:hypothetical protein